VQSLFGDVSMGTMKMGVATWTSEALNSPALSAIMGDELTHISLTGDTLRVEGFDDGVSITMILNIASARQDANNNGIYDEAEWFLPLDFYFPGTVLFREGNVSASGTMSIQLSRTEDASYYSGTMSMSVAGQYFSDPITMPLPVEESPATFDFTNRYLFGSLDPETPFSYERVNDHTLRIIGGAFDNPELGTLTVEDVFLTREGSVYRGGTIISGLGHVFLEISGTVDADRD